MKSRASFGQSNSDAVVSGRDGMDMQSAYGTKPSQHRPRMLVHCLGLSLADVHEYCNRSVSVRQLFRILRGRQEPTLFERKALAHALSRAVQERPEVLFNSV